MTDTAKRRRPAPIAGAAALDAALVLIFAAIGRGSHAEAMSASGLWQTAWPFLAGLAVSWLVCGVWRRPVALLRSGLPVWIGTVTLGLILRVAFTRGGAALPFVIVASATLALMLLGWRGIAALIGSVARRRPAR